MKTEQEIRDHLEEWDEMEINEDTDPEMYWNQQGGVKALRWVLEEM